MARFFRTNVIGSVRTQVSVCQQNVMASSTVQLTTAISGLSPIGNKTFVGKTINGIGAIGIGKTARNQFICARWTSSSKITTRTSLLACCGRNTMVVFDTGKRVDFLFLTSILLTEFCKNIQNFQKRYILLHLLFRFDDNVNLFTGVRRLTRNSTCTNAISIFYRYNDNSICFVFLKNVSISNSFMKQK